MLEGATVCDVGVTVGVDVTVTVIVALVASFDIPPLANKRASHVVPVAGAVNVRVAVVRPVAGSDFELFRYFQST